MNYKQTLDYLFAQLPMFQRIGAAAYRADLGPTIELCAMLGHPENAFKSIHIAGTNGKGSVSHLIASVLQSAGYKTGLYTSPHLKDFRERIKINGRKIPKAYVTDFVGKNRQLFDRIRPSFFEYTAVMAFQYFSDEKVDIAVIETGMGGRLDSTNVITPLISVITNISMDHTAFLGNTLPAIASEKAGIIKKNVPLVIGETQPDVQKVFLEKAVEMDSRIHNADENFILTRIGKNRFKITRMKPVAGKADITPIYSPLRGVYQGKNFITAFQVINLLGRQGYSITNDALKQGYKNVIRNTDILGRWQKISAKPKTICDIGHNEAGIQMIVNQLANEKFERLHWVFGLVSDKDADRILGLLPDHAVYYFCKADIPRGMDADELQDKAKKFGLKGEKYPSVREAYMAAQIAAGTNDLIFIGGSTFVVAEVL